MLNLEKTIDHGTLRRLVAAGAPVDAEVIAAGGSWGIVINYGRMSQTLAATRGSPRTFRQFETLAGYLKDLGIVQYKVNAAQFGVGAAADRAPNRRAAAASERMKLAHEAVAYRQWFDEQVQASIGDPRPSVSDDGARARLAARRQNLLKPPEAKAANKKSSRSKR